MRAFIDFDGVLFDIERAKKEYFQLFQKFGVSAREAVQTYQDMKEEIGRDEPTYHVEMLRKRFPKLKDQLLLRAIRNFKTKSKRFVFREAQEYLKEMRRDGFELHLVTTGSKEFQSVKIQSSDLKKFFAGIHILNSDYKGETILKLFKDSLPKAGGRKAVFIDDKASVTDEVKRCVQQISVIQISRKKGEALSRKADYVAKNLLDALGWTRKLV